MTRGRTLSSTPSGSELRNALVDLVTMAAGILDLYGQAEEIGYGNLRAGGSQVPSGEGDPTYAGVENGYRTPKDAPIDPVTGDALSADRLSQDRSALRSAVDAIAMSIEHMGRADARLRSIIRGHERSGKSADPEHGSAPSQTWTGHQAERVSHDWGQPRHEGLTDPHHWPRRREHR